MPWAVAGAVIGVAGSAITAASQSAGGQATGYSDAYKAQVAKNNATIANSQSAYAIQSGNLESQMTELKTSAQLGQIKAGQAASGFNVNTGSDVTVRQGVAESGAQDAMTIRMNAARQAYAYQVDASNDTAQSTLDTMAGQNAVTAGNTAAASTLVSAAGKVATNWDDISSAFDDDDDE